ncbi:MAG: nucleotidyl transferase AbiEii/AbiGii toxin family protein [Sphaerochaeta sp.]|nr:nucleotidyl transferase AbiEii/AbiGii toxin family protein [Sphaerochaeta sp.]
MKTYVSEYVTKNGENNPNVLRNRLKEAVQTVILQSLSRQRFFEQAAFYGGTALKLFHGLERFSEDLDFALLHPNHSFSIEPYIHGIKISLMEQGLEMSVHKVDKTGRSTTIESALVKGETLVNLLQITALVPPVAGIPRNELVKVKFEVDYVPPTGATYENLYLYEPLPSVIKLYDLSSMLAGKIHAVLCRNWSNRVKGRDYYDYFWFLKNGIPVNLTLVENKLKESGVINMTDRLTIENLKELLIRKIEGTNFKSAREDVLPFISDRQILETWNTDLFIDITRRRLG